MKTNQAIKLSSRARMTAIVPTLLARPAVLLGALFLAGGLSAAQVTWDADTGTSGAQDGGGTWSGVANNWWDGGANVLWPNTTSDIAVIGAGNAGGGAISTVGSINLNRLVLNPPLSNSYALMGGTLNFGGTTPTITNAGTSVIISNNITGSAGLTVVGNLGTTIIQGPGPNSFTGGLNLRSGTLLARDTVAVLGGNGTGSVTLGGTSGSASALLRIGNSLAITNPITTQSGSSGVVQIDNFGNYSPTFYGAVTLNKDLHIRNVWTSGSSRRPAFAGNFGGTGGIVISGQRADGYVHFLGNNSFSGGVTVQSGRLLLEGSTALGSVGSVLTLAGGARIDAQTPVTIANANPQRWLGDFNYVGSADLNLGTGSVTLEGNTAIRFTTASRTLTIGGGINGNGFGLAVFGALNGILQINGANAYSGNTSVDFGTTLALGSSATLPNSAEIFLASGGTMDVSAIEGGFNLGANSILGGSGLVNGSVNQVSGATLNPGGRAAAGALNINGTTTLNQGGKLWFDLSNDPVSGVNDQLAVGTLNCAGTNTLWVNPTANDFGAGNYTLINYSTLSAGDSNYFTLASPATQSRRTFSVDSSTFGQVNLTVGGSPLATLFWAGDGSANNWDYNTANTWTNGAALDVFKQLDHVVFDDTGSTSPVVNLVGALTSASITFSNQTKNYTLGGTGSLTGLGGITLQNTGTVTIANSGINTFSGPVNVNAGGLVITTTNALGKAAYVRMIGGTSEGYLGLTGGLTFNPVPMQLGGRTGSPVGPQLVNVSGNNVWPGSITMNSGGGYYGIRSDSGKLTIAGNVAPIASLGDNRTLTLEGAGDGEVTGRIGNSTSTTATHATASVRKLGAGTWTVSNTNYYGGSTTVDQGTLVINGSIIGSGVTVNAGTLGGNGTITAPVTVNSGGNLAPGTSIGTLKVVGNAVLNGTTTMEIARNGAALTNDLVADINALTLGGSLVVLNTGSSPLQAGDTFKLFAAASYAGGFTNISLPSGFTFNTNNLAINGTIQVATVVPTIPTTPTNLTFSVSGSPVNVISLSWPTNYLGWSLEMQTNSLGVGLGTNWVVIPGSELVTSTNMPVITTNGAVFFRMKYVP